MKCEMNERCEMKWLCDYIEICPPQNLGLKFDFFEKQNWILLSSVHYIAVTLENNFLDHHTDTVEMFCEKVYLYVEIC